MARKIKVPKRINGYKLSKPARRRANRLLARFQGEELEMLLGALVGAALAHFTDRKGKSRLGHRLREVLGSHLAS